MNIIRTLPCGCHRGLCECPVASHLHTAMNVARDTAYRQIPSLFDEGQQAAWRAYEQCCNAYAAHFEQRWTRKGMLV